MKKINTKIIGLLLIFVLFISGCRQSIQEKDQLEPYQQTEQDNLESQSEPEVYEEPQVYEEEQESNLIELFDNTFEQRDDGLYLIEGKHKKYLDNVVIRDTILRQKAVEITSECSSKDKDCQVFYVYNWVVNNLRYVSDPRGEGDYIQSPSDTIRIGGGDCEDLTSLTMSLLEGLSIKTYMVLTENHAYALACGVDINSIGKNYINKVSYEWISFSDSESLMKRGYFRVLELNENEEQARLRIEIESDNPIDITVLSSERDMNIKLGKVEGETVYYSYKSCSGEGVKNFKTECVVRNGAYLLLQNAIDQSSYISMKVFKYVSHEEPSKVLSYYTLDGETCIILETTVGKNGYPGYVSKEEYQEKLAIDPYTYKTFKLN